MRTGREPSSWRLLLLHLLAFACLRIAPAAADPGGPAGTAPHLGLPLRADAIVVRLEPAAARTAAARRPAAAALRAASIGVSSLDAVAASLGGATFEPEFPAEPRALRAGHAVDEAREAALAAFYVVHLPRGADRGAALAAFGALPEVAQAGPIALAPVEAVPDDSLWSKSWHLWQPSRHDIGAPEAWDRVRGDSAIVVAIIDTGVLLDHPDLRDRIWRNAAEAGGLPGVDDDGNGFVDDVRGWDFVWLGEADEVVPGEDWRDADNDPNDYTSHGTAVAGIVGAHANNGLGVTGVAWDVRLMPLRAGYSAAAAPSGWVDMRWAAQAMVYAARNGASVINVSFSSVPTFDLVAATDYAIAAGVTVVAAAGNGQPEHYLPDRDDVIGVAATDTLDVVARFSNRGRYVALAAPGVRLPSTLLVRPGTDSLGVRQPSYTLGATGTSFSAPVVAGAAALLQADRRARGLRPLTPYEVQVRLAETAADISASNPGVTGYGTGRLDLPAALDDGPARSFAVPVHARTVGPGVRLTYLVRPRERLANVTADGRLVLADLAPSGVADEVRLSGAPLGGLAAADLGDGRGPGLFVGTRAGMIDGFTGAGTRLPGWPVAITGVDTSRRAMPAIGDLDGDGRPEVVWGGSDGRVSAWRTDGLPVPGFPRVLGGARTAVRIALGDLDGWPGLELVATLQSGPTYVLDATGATLPGWPVAGEASPMPPLVARLGPSAEPCVVVACPGHVSAFTAGGAERFRVLPPGFETRPPVAADLDRDGSDEILLVRASPESVVVLDHAGRAIRSWNAGAYILPSEDVDLLVGGMPDDGTGAGDALFVRGAEGELMALHPDGTAVRGFPKVGGGDPSEVFDADPVTFVVSGSGRDSALFLHSSWAASRAAPNVHAWPAQRANAARTGCRLGAPPLGRVDDDPPPPIDDFAATLEGEHGAVLEWTARGGDVAGYDLRWSTAPLDAASFGSARVLPDPGPPPGPLARVRVPVAGLAEHATVHLAVRARDAAGNLSALSNVATVETGGLAPAAVTDLRATIVTDSSVVLRWTATGDDGAVGRPGLYRVHVAFAPLDSATFGSAPIAQEVASTVDAGGLEGVVLRRIEPGRRHWIALVARDGSGEESPLSNVVEVDVPLPVPPARVADLGAPAVTDSSVSLRWTATGEDGTTGRPRLYRVRAAFAPLDSAAFESAPIALDLPASVDAGGTERLVLRAVEAGRRHWIALVARDAAGHESPLSNVLEVDVPLPVPPAAVADVVAAATTDSSVSLRWTATGEDGETGRATLYRVHASPAPMNERSFEWAPVTRTCAATVAAGGTERFAVGGLERGVRYWIALVARDARGHESPLSNQVSVVAVRSTPPARINDLRPEGGTDSTLVVAWSATAGDANDNGSLRYLLRADRAPLDSRTFGSAPIRLDLSGSGVEGTKQTAVVCGVARGDRLWIAVVAENSSGLASSISNVASAVPGPFVARTDFVLTPRSVPSTLPVELWWQNAGGAPRSLRIHDVSGRLVRELRLGREPDGVVTWDGRDRDGARVRAGVYFVAMVGERGMARTRIVVLE